MNKRGHIWFAIGIGAVALYLLRDLEIITLPTKTLLFYLPFYLLGAILVDKIETPTSRWHRGFLHSRRMLLLTIFLIIPFFYWKSAQTPNKFFLGFAFDYWSLGFVGMLGHITHLIGDSLTSRLPR